MTSQIPLLLLLLFLCLRVSIATTELVHLSVLFRHGHRSPMTLLPGENFTIPTTLPDGLGQLTNIGKRDEFDLGQFLRKRYGSFVGSRYNSSEHLIRSTDRDRTLMSAQACLSGLFPPVGDQQWSKDPIGQKWQPIPVHTVPTAYDWLLASPDFPCPERERQFAALGKDPDRLALYQPYTKFMSKLSKGSGIQVTPDTVHQVLDTLWIDKVAGLPSPSWLNTSGGADWDMLVAAGSLQWNEYSWTPDLISFGSGVLLDHILSTMQMISQGSNLSDGGQKLRMFSDHDTTVASVLAALGNRDFVWPSFASCLMFELHRSGSSDFSVQVWFRNTTSDKPLAIPLPLCGLNCSLDHVLTVLQSTRMTSQQLRDRCKHPGVFNDWSVRALVLLGVAGALLLTACCGLAALLICRFRRHGRDGVAYRTLGSVE